MAQKVWTQLLSCRCFVKISLPWHTIHFRYKWLKSIQSFGVGIPLILLLFCLACLRRIFTRIYKKFCLLLQNDSLWVWKCIYLSKYWTPCFTLTNCRRSCFSSMKMCVQVQIFVIVRYTEAFLEVFTLCKAFSCRF